MSKLVSYEAIFAALAVVAIGSGCSKREEVKPEAVPASAASAPAAAAAPPAAPGAVADPAPPADFLGATPAVDAGREMAKKKADEADKATGSRSAPPAAARPADGNIKPSKNAQAACGAGTCSADMKK